MILGKLPYRGTDAWGDGSFGASRGSRIHKGIDFSCYPETEICSPVDGVVTKLGYCYSDDLFFRYVQVTDIADQDHRLFYVLPTVSLKDYVRAGDVIGEAQNISKKHSTPDRYMKNHIHYEIKDGKVFINPDTFVPENIS